MNTLVNASRFFGGGLRMEWDALNRLRKVHYNNNTPGNTADDTLLADMLYDCGNRRMRVVFTNNDTLNGTTDYYYHGWRVYEERDGTDAVIRQYTYGNYLDEVWTLDDRSGGTTVAQLNDGTGAQRQFNHCNTLYSIFALTDETGAITEGYQYNAYGKPTVWSGPGVDTVWFTNDDVVSTTTNGTPVSAAGNFRLYTGQYWVPFDSPETGLYYMRNRFKSADLGRFLSRDPIGGISLYEYVGSRATRSTDSLGLQADEPIPEDASMDTTVDPQPAPNPDLPVGDMGTDVGDLGGAVAKENMMGGEEYWKHFVGKRKDLNERSRQLLQEGMAGGCRGIVQINLGTNVGMFADCFDTPERAEAYRKKLDMKCRSSKLCYWTADARARIYAIRYYSKDEKEGKPDSKGRITIDGGRKWRSEKIDKDIGWFDFAIRDEGSGKWIGALAGADNYKEVTVVGYTLEDFLGGDKYNRKAFCVKCEDVWWAEKNESGKKVWTRLSKTSAAGDNPREQPSQLTE